jgi:hypothetical protein
MRDNIVFIILERVRVQLLTIRSWGAAGTMAGRGTARKDNEHRPNCVESECCRAFI